MNPPSSLTPVQRATMCADIGAGAEMLAACQFVMGCYGTAKKEPPAKLKEKLAKKFYSATQANLPVPDKKISFGAGNSVGLDYAALQRLLPADNRIKRVDFSKQVKPIARANSFPPANTTTNTNNNSNSNTTTTTTSTTSTFSKNVNYSSNTKPPQDIPPPKPTPTVNKPLPAKRKFEEEEEEEEPPAKQDDFTTAKEKYITDCATKGVKPKSAAPPPSAASKNSKTLGGRRKGFNVPFKKDVEAAKDEEPPPPPAPEKKTVSSSAITKPPAQPDESNPNKIESINGVPLDDERLVNIEPRMLEIIVNEILDKSPKVDWDDIAGLKFAKQTVYEMVVWPALNSDLFTGLRTPPKGLLLFGPPGTGKTLIGKAIASSSGATFFNITASSLTSKWIGEGEKMVRAMFAVARCYQPAVIFIDEIDSLLTQRGDNEHESSRRVKNEFLAKWDGAGNSKEDRLLLVGATNIPHQLDEAARRRLVKRVYIPLPDQEAREQLIRNLLKKQDNSLTDADVEKVGQQTHGYSGADLFALCSEAALGPVRSLKTQDLRNVTANNVRPVSMSDFRKALRQVRASVSEADLHQYEDWNKLYGSTPETEAQDDEDEYMEDDAA